MTAAGTGITLAFLGYVDPAGADRAGEYEDRVLPLVEEHGGRVVFRGRRFGDDPTEPQEVQVLWMPSQAALDDYIADERRASLLADYGEVFESTTVIRVDPVTSNLHPS